MRVKNLLAASGSYIYNWTIGTEAEPITLKTWGEFVEFPFCLRRKETTFLPLA